MAPRKSELEYQSSDEAVPLGCLSDGTPNVVSEDYDDGKWIMGEGSSVAAADAAPRTLYVRRDLLNGDEVRRHFADQMSREGAAMLMDAGKLHVTVAYSKTPVDWAKLPADWFGSTDEEGRIRVKPGGMRMMERLGPDGQVKAAVVMQFTSSDLTYRWRELCEAGCSWDFEDYQPHVTIAWDVDQAIDPSSLRPWQGELVFGPEIFEEVDEDWKAKEGVRE